MPIHGGYSLTPLGGGEGGPAPHKDTPRVEYMWRREYIINTNIKLTWGATIVILKGVPVPRKQLKKKRGREKLPFTYKDKRIYVWCFLYIMYTPQCVECPFEGISFPQQRSSPPEWALHTRSWRSHHRTLYENGPFGVWDFTQKGNSGGRGKWGGTTATATVSVSVAATRGRVMADGDQWRQCGSERAIELGMFGIFFYP